MNFFKNKMDKETKELDLYLIHSYYNKIARDCKALNISQNSFLSWLLLRGCIDLHHNRSALKGYEKLRNEKEKKRIHLRLSVKIYDKLKGVAEGKDIPLSNLILQIIAMEYNGMEEYTMIREPQTRKASSFKNVIIKLNPELQAQLDNMSELTNIKRCDLIPLMLSEYLMILDRGKYQLPE